MSEEKKKKKKNAGRRNEDGRWRGGPADASLTLHRFKGATLWLSLTSAIPVEKAKWEITTGQQARFNTVKQREVATQKGSNAKDFPVQLDISLHSHCNTHTHIHK